LLKALPFMRILNPVCGAAAVGAPGCKAVGGDNVRKCAECCSDATVAALSVNNKNLQCEIPRINNQPGSFQEQQNNTYPPIIITLGALVLRTLASKA
jgi:hypothetical protein